MLAKHGIRHTPRSFCTGVMFTPQRVWRKFALRWRERCPPAGWRLANLVHAGLPVERGTPPKVKAEPDFA